MCVALAYCYTVSHGVKFQLAAPLYGVQIKFSCTVKVKYIVLLLTVLPVLIQFYLLLMSWKSSYVQFPNNWKLPCDTCWRKIKIPSKFDIDLIHCTVKFQSMEFLILCLDCKQLFKNLTVFSFSKVTLSPQRRFLSDNFSFLSARFSILRPM